MLADRQTDRHTYTNKQTARHAHHKFTFHNTPLLCRSDDIRTFGVESAWYSVVQYSLLGTCTTSLVLYKTTTKRVLTDDVQPSSSADAGRVVGPVDADHALKPLSVLARLDDEPRRRQTARDVEPAQASPSSNRHVTNERELQPSTYGNCL